MTLSTQADAAIRYGLGAVNLLLDGAADQSLRAVRSDLQDAGIGSVVGRLRLSMAVAPGLSAQRLGPALQRLAGPAARLSVRFSHVGAFRRPHRVIFLGVTPTQELLSLHSDLHRVLTEERVLCPGFYVPDHWNPHCTIALPDSERALVEGLEIVGRHTLPVSATVRGVSLADLSSGLEVLFTPEDDDFEGPT